MFNESTQKKNWLFNNSAELISAKQLALKAHLETKTPVDPITFDEQELLLHFYAKELIEFCLVFKPPVPYSTIYTALTYFKRIYLKECAMQFHPNDMIFACSYLAFKVDEYNISIDHFIAVLPRELRTIVGMTVIGFELTIMNLMNYDLTVYSPFRPLRGLITDMKVRHRELGEVEILQDKSIKNLFKMILTDVTFLFPPSQIALHSVYKASEELGVEVDSYFEVCLFSENEGNLSAVREMLQSQTKILDNSLASKSQYDEARKKAEQKLEKCRNNIYNPRDENFLFKTK